MDNIRTKIMQHGCVEKHCQAVMKPEVEDRNPKTGIGIPTFDIIRVPYYEISHSPHIESRSLITDVGLIPHLVTCQLAVKVLIALVENLHSPTHSIPPSGTLAALASSRYAALHCQQAMSPSELCSPSNSSNLIGLVLRAVLNQPGAGLCLLGQDHTTEFLPW
ncbi:hypothetical protein BGZ63DRAFT_399010 [Mariannaea sp. PMI_226]|nr:hypothetical protein BGZ63DRAFT_399010 [Mariannaea sp. PMI_226]